LHSWPRAAPVPVIISNQDEGAPVPVGPGPSLLGTGESADPAAAPFVPPHEGKSESYDWDFKQTMLLAACTSRRSLPVLPPAFHALDPVGNRGSAVSTLGVVQSGSWTFNADDQISSENYDANGNTTRAANGNMYTYDSENHMTSMRSGSTLVTMQYDAFGNRVSKTVNGVTTQYLVEDDVNPTGLPQVIEEVRNGAAVRTYTYGLQRISQNQVVNNTWTPSFYGYDGFGTVRQLTNAAGAVTDSYEYDAFGNPFTKSGTTPNNYLYRGEQYDADLGLYYLRARYYNPVTGRFFSRDPEDGFATDPKTLHKYAYAGGDPVNAMDPTGHETLVNYGLITATMFGTFEVLREYDIYTHRWKTLSGPATIVALKQLACSVNAWIDGSAVALTQGLQGEFSDKIDIDTVECTARPRKSDRCQELARNVDIVKATLNPRSCNSSMSPTEIMAMVFAWQALADARTLEHAECYNNQPDQNHQDELDHALLNEAKCLKLLQQAWGKQ